MESQSKIRTQNNPNEKCVVSEFRKVCSELTSLIVSLFDVEGERFIFCSRSFDAVLGYRPEMLTEGGWELWFTLLKPAVRPVIQEKLSGFVLQESHDAGGRRLAIEYHVKDVEGKWVCIGHEIQFRRFAGVLLALNLMYDHSEKEVINDFFGGPKQAFNGSGFSKPQTDISGREKQVLRLIACGLSSKQIAGKLCISKHTVISHRKNLIEKFRVNNTAELIYEASKVSYL